MPIDPDAEETDVGVPTEVANCDKYCTVNPWPFSLKPVCWKTEKPL